MPTQHRSLSGELKNQSDLKQKLKRYTRNWYLFLISIVFFMALAFLYLRYATPIYSIKAKILIKDDEKGAGALDPSDAFSDLNLFAKNQNINNEIEVFKGKALMARVMAELEMQTTYYTEGAVKTIEIYGEELPIKVVPSNLKATAYGKVIRIRFIDSQGFELIDDAGTYKGEMGKLIKRPYGTFTVTSTENRKRPPYVDVQFHELSTIGDFYNAQVNVAPIDKEASVLNISLEDAVPQKGIDIVDKLIELYNREAIEDKNQIAENTIRFIDERLAGLVMDLTAVEKNVEDYKKKHNISDVGIEAQNYVQEASGYSREVTNYETQISVLESLQSYLQRSKSNELVPGSMGIEDPTLIRLTTRYNELQLEKQRLLRTQTEANPLVKGIDEQIQNLRANIGENLSNIKKSLVINRNNLSANTGRYRARVSNVPTIERNLLEIQRQQGIKEALYSYLLQKREEAAISLASAVSNLRIIDAARATKWPISPKPMLIYLAAFILALITPIVYFSIKDALNEQVQYADDVEKITDVPILGEVTHNLLKETMVFNGTSRSEISEIFRLIRSNLKYAFPNEKKQVILITSSMTAEGKTFVAANLAASLAITGKKVVLLEFDLRIPKLLKALGLPTDKPGIVEYLNDPLAKATNFIVPVKKVNGLFVMPAGALPHNPSELLINKRVETLFEELKQDFDHIIVDSSPVGQVADAFSLSEYTQLVLYIVRYHYTYKQQINIINDIGMNNKFNNVMILLNDAKRHNGYTYGYGYSKGYGYGK